MMIRPIVVTTLLLPLFFGAANCVRAQPSLADMIERAEQSVVRIEVSGVDGDSLGSGFVVDNQGTLITNCHVLAGAHSAEVHFPDGKRCQIVGTMIIDESRDIVVGKLSITDAPALPLASGLPRKGERVTALGSPHGLSFTATTGIVSATRSAQEMASDVGRDNIQGMWIQVDAPLSPGNSGGPLINSAGEVIGMSTLASQGSAQNLNFGISVGDIRNAIKYARGVQPVSLTSAAAKIKMHESEGGSPEGPDGILRERTIPKEVLAAYVQNGIDQFEDLMRGLRTESVRLSADLKEMKRGTTFIPPALQSAGVSIVRATLPGQRIRRWYFRSQDLKDSTISRQQEKIREYNSLKTDIKSPEDADSLYALLWNCGPRIDTRRSNSIGWADDIIVLHSFNAHDVLVQIDDVPYLLWAQSTSGLFSGELLSGPVFVAGTSTAQLMDGLTASVTVLQQITEDQLRSSVTEVVGAASEYRTWQDTSGQFAVEAKFLGADADKVILQKPDGSIINVPRNSLCPADLDYISRQ